MKQHQHGTEPSPVRLGPDPSPPEDYGVKPETLRRATLAGFAGTVVEWFDFAVYGFMAPIIAQTFFASESVVISLLQTFAVFAVAFALRPVGGALFGMLGDRLGRKQVLITTVLLMSGSTAVIGLLPGYQQIGVWAAVLLTLARCAQGLSAGGEYAGAVTYVIEHAPAHQRARWGSAMPTATFFAFAVAALLSFLLSAGLGQSAMEQWGWRIPFLVAAPLGLVAFWIRRRLDESPLFQEIKDSTAAPEHAPLRTTLAEQGKPMLILGGYISLTALSFYIFSTYMTTFLRNVVGMDATSVLLSNVIALSCAAVLAPFVGILCDRIGRRRTMFASVFLLILTAYPGYLLASSGTFGGALGGQIMIMLGTVSANVVTAVLLTEVFPTRVRYTAAGITYNISYALFGGTAPFIATLLIDLTGSPMAPAVYLTAIAVGAFVAAMLLPETSGRRLGAGVDDGSITTAAEPGPR
ncbi:MFS transporter [Paeniglutamicibacter psychrophenolicus]|uniref:MHS family proline/betaine transporter-like MFS transporter n=1 Tax=Paeniglutamicibacter psychrophenolicus TaxID=257454 RepID=A0ABS4W9W5_9MICC|nr:MFS transporter [Paeniglutamicibacter psychrophenolicus]MBP2372996.1 MHS family proline/betaine transporter-like MFS transporter [Paeniglutamicibacter psychrophenolicus]